MLFSYNDMILISIIKFMGVYLRKFVSNLLFITTAKSFFYIICQRVYISLTFGKIQAILFLFSCLCVPKCSEHCNELVIILCLSFVAILVSQWSKTRFRTSNRTLVQEKMESLFLVQCFFLTTQKDCIWLTVVLLALEELLRNRKKTQKTNKQNPKKQAKKHQGKKGSSSSYNNRVQSPEWLCCRRCLSSLCGTGKETQIQKVQAKLGANGLSVN